jgi:hypothetical protein
LKLRNLLCPLLATIFISSLAWAGVFSGDLDLDTDIDGSDFAVFTYRFITRHPDADLSRDNMITAADVETFSAKFGEANVFTTIYDVGPGRPYADPSEVPWEALQPGSLVRIYYRTQPYANKWVIARAGTAEAPIVVRGVAQDGKLPIITGENAVTRLELDYWNENRWVIKVGGSSMPSQFPSYLQTFVYGNVLIKHDVQENSQVLHYGGDSGNYDNYRKGILWFYNNTVVSYRSGNTTLLGISTNDEQVECFNNVVYATAGGQKLAVMGTQGIVSLYNNWLSQGWKAVHGTLNGTLTTRDNLSGDDPGFSDFPGRDYALSPDSPCIDAGAALPSPLLPDHHVIFQYDRHQTAGPRLSDGRVDQGAFEF